MKIRIKGNSIRMRLTRSEVEQLGRDGYIEERTDFGNNHLFLYALRTTNDSDQLSASFVGIKITMLVPAAMAADWATSDTVGFSGSMDLGNGTSLSLLLEKDFRCIDADVKEDQSDNYENPLISCE
jgi:hypothetical protein